MHSSAVASTQAELSDHAGNMHFKAQESKPEGLLFKGPDKVLGLRGTTVPKEPLGPSLELFKLDSEAGLDTQAIKLGIPPPSSIQSKDFKPASATVFSGVSRKP